MSTIKQLNKTIENLELLIAAVHELPEDTVFNLGVPTACVFAKVYDCCWDFEEVSKKFNLQNLSYKHRNLVLELFNDYDLFQNAVETGVEEWLLGADLVVSKLKATVAKKQLIKFQKTQGE